jgi:outer membrane immunogenic protein
MRRSLGTIFAATVAAFGATQFASAADLPQPAPVYAKAPPSVAPYSWTGFYVGGNIGYGWGNANNNVTLFDSNFAFTLTQSQSGKPQGIIGGGQFGYNWQFSPHGVFGLEADWQGSGAAANQSFVDPFVLPGQVTGTVSANYGDRISWFGTVRGRVGYAWDSLLIYGTGGLAYGEVKLAGTVNETIMGPGFGPASAIWPFSVSKVNAGWTVGAGIEGALASSWTWKAEYLYLDLGSITGVSPAGLSGGTGATLTAQGRFTDNILRAGLNFQFH